MENLSLIIPAFIAGLLTFLAPCTLPLVPAYLSFISGATAKDLNNASLSSKIHKRVLLNGVFYVLGFSAVFIFLGIVFGLGGVALARYQAILEKVGGVFIVFFGLYLMHVFDRVSFLRFLSGEKRFRFHSSLKPGTPQSSLILGATFALGWSPCIGPILGTILLLATSTATVVQSAILLGVFSLGLAVPFLILALGIGHASHTIRHLSRVLPYISFIGGAFLLLIGILLLTGHMGLWLTWVYELFGSCGYDQLTNYL